MIWILAAEAMTRKPSKSLTVESVVELLMHKFIQITYKFLFPKYQCIKQQIYLEFQQS
jgi:hypothetical protein